MRKKNKLPAEKYSVNFKLEYGESIIEMHKDSINKNEKILLIDDLIATDPSIELILHGHTHRYREEQIGRVKVSNRSTNSEGVYSTYREELSTILSPISFKFFGLGGPTTTTTTTTTSTPVVR